ncbi:type II toxin-antitoxin system VapC family toxin [Buttiauxella sp. S04-F03]|uniref:type II toxin-antitoxin system VapC family toxin n=1 Tax=Buttiauxella sp. W03-F01 TaxID=2904524 RepID=UPI001E4AEB23|nr:type II toxin-antitoxin system VapC family toxin [Buttiauxella sp. W03-F01]MCE0801596.1 type II toxin-antitoxin system VapC family toxin [Buttiauxella sp. W03-F01]
MVKMMQSAVFDTNILIDYLKGIPQARATIESYSNSPSISIVTWMEIMVGAKHNDQEQQTRHFLSGFEILPVNHAVAEHSVALRQQYGMKLPDAIILASTQISARKLITRNSKDFKDLPGVILPYSLG